MPNSILTNCLKESYARQQENAGRPFEVGKDVFRRNKIIADLLSRAGLIEKVGSGFARMKNYCKEVNAPLFKLDVNEKYFRIEFFKSKDYLDMTIEGAGEKLIQVDEWLTQVNARLTQELSDNEKKIIFFIIKNNKINSTDLQNLLKISRVMANRYFNKLIKKKLILRKAMGKSTYYILIEVKKDV